jgi:tetratricopeptide (TPR) repeat protein
MPSKKNARKRKGASVPHQKTAAAKETEAGSPESTSKAAGWLFPLVPVVIAAAASVNSLWNDFATDDLQQVLANNFIKRLSNLPHAFTTSVWAFANGDVVFSVDSYYRPLFSALFCINHALFGTIPFGWHLVNVLIHVGVTFLVFVVIKDLTQQRSLLSSASASLFAVHPTHAESVAWTSGVTDPLMALFLLPSFLFYVKWRRNGNRALLSLSLLLYFFALLTKETSLALPIVVTGYELLYERRSKLWSSLANATARGAIFVPPTLVYFAMRYNALHSLLFTGGSRFPSHWGLLTAPTAVLKYLKLMLVPIGYSYQHLTRFVTNPFQAAFFGPVAVIALITAALLRFGSKEVKFGMLWFIAFLLPSLAAISQFDQEYVVQERYLYLPSIGFCFVFALGIEWLRGRSLDRVQGRVLAPVLTVVLIAIWATAYVVNNHVWRDSISVYKNTVAKAPDSAEAHCTLSRAYYETGRAREAQIEADRALELDPDLGMTYLNLSYYAHRSGRMNQAISYLEQGASTIPASPLTRHSLGTIYLNLALLLAQKPDLPGAEEAYEKSIDVSPRAVGWYYAGQFYYDQSRYNEAREMFEKARDRVPRWFAPIHLKLAQVYDRLGRDDLAKLAYQRFLEVAPPGDENRADAERKLKRL